MSTGADIPNVTPQPPSDAFRFGRNWQRYLARSLDSGREQIAADSLAELVGDLRGKTFLDIGCGSGLFSLCAYRAGATQVVSLDVDRDSVAATRSLQSRSGSPANWEVHHRSILEPSLAHDIKRADVVYAWGVLHHTGDMYTAIKNAASLAAPNGLFVIAIYNRVNDKWLSSDLWWHIKRKYNHSNRATQIAMEAAYATHWSIAQIRRHDNPLRVARNYRQSRGMAVWTDLVDWLGGYPYEYATVDEIVSFCEAECDVRLVRAVPEPENGTGNNEFVFVRTVDTLARPSAP